MPGPIKLLDLEDTSTSNSDSSGMSNAASIATFNESDPFNESMGVTFKFT